MALGFYEKVVVVRSDKFPELVGRAGYVLGISEENGTVLGYAVSFLSESENYFFGTNDLQGSGEFADRILFYNELEPHLRVRVVDGKGEIVD